MNTGQTIWWQRKGATQDENAKEERDKSAKQGRRCWKPDTPLLALIAAVDMLEQDHTLSHALISRVFVKGAQPGDALEVEVLDFQHKALGSSYK